MSQTAHNVIFSDGSAPGSRITSPSFLLPDAQSPEEVKPGEAPPVDESTAPADSESQSQPTEKETTTGRSAIPGANNGGEL